MHNGSLEESTASVVQNAYEIVLIKGKDTYTEQQVGLLSKIDIEGPARRDESRESYPIEKGSTCGYNTGVNSHHTSGVSKHMITNIRLPSFPPEMESNETISKSSDMIIAVIVVHFKAFPTDPKSCAKREAQATVIRRVVEEEIKKVE